MDQTQLDNLGETLLVSPCPGAAHGYLPPSEAVYVQQVEQVREVRVLVRAGTWPSDFMVEHLGSSEMSPILEKYLSLSTSTVHKAADAVRRDHPFDIWDLVVSKYAADEGIAPATPADHQGDAFVESVLRRAAAHQLIAEGLNKAFDVKYAFGTARPIEYYDPSLQRFATPNHPECPAGHGAFSGAASKAFETLFSPTQDQIDAVEFATKQYAMFRSLSAMHIPYSNLLGWQIGHEA